MPAMESAEITALRETVCALHAELVRNGLVAWTSGNVSARLADSELMVIKPSGVSYDDLTPESMGVWDLDGQPVGRARRRHPCGHRAGHCYGAQGRFRNRGHRETGKTGEAGEAGEAGENRNIETRRVYSDSLRFPCVNWGGARGAFV